MAELYQLRCRECGKLSGNAPRSFCEDCFSPLEVTYDYDALKKSFRRDALAARPLNIWRYAELLPLPENFRPSLPVGGTPLVPAPRLAKDWGLASLYIKNDAVCFPTLSFKDRVVAVALATAREFGFHTVGCSSTGNLANAVAAQAVRSGLHAWIFIPADLEPAKILATAVYGARIARIAGNYDHVSRLCAQIADKFHWGLVNVNLRPYYADGPYAIKEIRESGGWAEDATDAEIVAAIRKLAVTEGIFTETAGGVTSAAAEKLVRQGRIGRNETTVLCITGNGLKTTDALTGEFPAEEAIAPRLDAFEAYLEGRLAGAATAT